MIRGNPVYSPTLIQSVFLSLQVVFLHNKDVTNVEIFVSDTAALVAVDGAVESMIADWVKNGCPRYTRETIAPFEVKEMSSSKCDFIIKLWRTTTQWHDTRLSISVLVRKCFETILAT